MTRNNDFFLTYVAVTSENGSGTYTMTFVTILCLGMLHLLLR